MLSRYLLPGVPLIESPFFAESLASLPEAYRPIAVELNRKGYAVFDFPDDDLENKVDGIKRDFHGRYDWRAWREGKLDSLRIQDAWKEDARVRAIATNEKVLAMLSALYGRQAFPFQTLNFAVGTQQAAHSDYPHFNSIPDRYMCGVWVAFEDTDDDNGPLFYYPGSHKWPSYQNEHLGVSYKDVAKGYPEYHRYVELWNKLAELEGLDKTVFRARRGQALIWTANLVHGGSVQKDLSRTRWSQVTHYFFEGCSYTTPLANDAYQGQVYFRDIVDVRTGRPVPNMVSGEPVKESFRKAARPDLSAAKPKGDERRSRSRYRFHPDLPVGFDPEFYIRAHPDLAAAKVDPYEHYLVFGKAEGRRYSAG